MLFRHRCLQLHVGRGVVVIVIVAPDRMAPLCPCPIPCLTPLLLLCLLWLCPRACLVASSSIPRPLILLLRPLLPSLFSHCCPPPILLIVFICLIQIQQVGFSIDPGIPLPTLSVNMMTPTPSSSDNFLTPKTQLSLSLSLSLYFFMLKISPHLFFSYLSDMLDLSALIICISLK